MATYTLTFQTVSLPAGSGGATVTIEEDSDSDGAVENSDTISLVDGTTTYETADVFTQSGEIRAYVEFGAPSDLTAASATVVPLDFATAKSLTRSVSISGDGTITVTRSTSTSRSTEIYNAGAIDATRLVSRTRSVDVSGDGNIDLTRQPFTKARATDISGDGATDVTRGTLTKPRNPQISGDGAIVVENVGTSKSRTANSYVDTITSFASSERTSLELIDFDVTYDESNATWYTDWFQEDRILGDEDTLAIIAYTATDAKDPAATVYVEYDGSGNGNPDRRSEPVSVGERGRVHAVENVPSDEEGYYRLLISEYSGYNSLTNLNIGLVH